MWLVALGIAVKILFVSNEQKNCNGKPDRKERPNKYFQELHLYFFWVQHVEY